MFASNHSMNEFQCISRGDSWRQSFGSRTSATHPITISSTMTDTIENESQIGSFYRDRSVFITGATGFMGKVCTALSYHYYIQWIFCLTLFECQLMTYNWNLCLIKMTRFLSRNCSVLVVNWKRFMFFWGPKRVWTPAPDSTNCLTQKYKQLINRLNNKFW